MLIYLLAAILLSNKWPWQRQGKSEPRTYSLCIKRSNWREPTIVKTERAKSEIDKRSGKPRPSQDIVVSPF